MTMLEELRESCVMWVAGVAMDGSLTGAAQNAVREGFAKLAEQIERDARDAAIGAVVWRFIDRMTDVAPPEDSAERILSEFVDAVMPAIKAAMSKDGE